jgi:hypothetical protein
MAMGKRGHEQTKLSGKGNTKIHNYKMETLVDYLKTHKPKGFSPKPYYSEDGDSLTYYFQNDESYGERVDDCLTVYRSTKNAKLVGCQIKGLPSALKLLGDFGLLITDGEVALGMIFIACMAANPPPKPETKKWYLELGKMTKDTVIPRRELEPALPR